MDSMRLSDGSSHFKLHTCKKDLFWAHYLSSTLKKRFLIIHSKKCKIIMIKHHVITNLQVLPFLSFHERTVETVQNSKRGRPLNGGLFLIYFHKTQILQQQKLKLSLSIQWCMQLSKNVRKVGNWSISIYINLIFKSKCNKF